MSRPHSSSVKKQTRHSGAWPFSVRKFQKIEKKVRDLLNGYFGKDKLTVKEEHRLAADNMAKKEQRYVQQFYQKLKLLPRPTAHMNILRVPTSELDIPSEEKLYFSKKSCIFKLKTVFSKKIISFNRKLYLL